jgi:hypothetical protein
VKALVPILLVAGLVGAPTASAADRCDARGAKTVQQNTQARVFAVKGKGEVKRRIYGCVRGRKPILLASDVAPRDAEETAFRNTSFRLGGRVVAWVQEAASDFGVGEFGRGIIVRPVERGGRRLHVDVTDYEAVAALRVRGDGAVAWVLTTRGPYSEVDAVESDGKTPVALAYARGIAAASLRFEATAVHWTQDGADRSAEVR